jgi:acyl carrier protein
MNELGKIINKIVENKGQTPFSTLNLDCDLRIDLGFDSLDLAELTVRCEQAFGIDIFEDGIVTTVKEVIEKLNV